MIRPDLTPKSAQVHAAFLNPSRTSAPLLVQCTHSLCFLLEFLQPVLRNSTFLFCCWYRSCLNTKRLLQLPSECGRPISAYTMQIKKEFASGGQPTRRTRKGAQETEPAGKRPWVEEHSSPLPEVIPRVSHPIVLGSMGGNGFEVKQMWKISGKTMFISEP